VAFLRLLSVHGGGRSEAFGDIHVGCAIARESKMPVFQAEVKERTTARWWIVRTETCSEEGRRRTQEAN
jgi:hypothetical protein